MTGTATKLPPPPTVADLPDWPGEGTATRCELLDGVLRAMAPGSDTQNAIGMIGCSIASRLAATTS
jgi:hypothetical protein